METIETLLTKHGISPTLVPPSEKKNLAAWITDAEKQAFSEFEQLVFRIQKESINSQAKISEDADALLSLVQKTADSLSPLLEGYPQRAISFAEPMSPHLLVQKHVALLSSLEDIEERCMARSSDLIAPLENEDQTSETELLLRHIALAEVNAPLLVAYEKLEADLPLISEKLSTCRKALAEANEHLYQTVSAISARATKTLAAVHHQKEPQAHYFRSLQESLLTLHNLAQSIKQIQKEASHVQILDVL